METVKFLRQGRLRHVKRCFDVNVVGLISSDLLEAGTRQRSDPRWPASQDNVAPYQLLFNIDLTPFSRGKTPYPHDRELTYSRYYSLETLTHL